MRILENSLPIQNKIYRRKKKPAIIYGLMLCFILVAFVTCVMGCSSSGDVTDGQDKEIDAGRQTDGNSSGKASGTASGTDTGNASGTDTGNASGMDTGNASGTDTGNASGTDTGNASGMDKGNASGTDTGTASGTGSEKTSENESGKKSETDSEKASGEDTGNASGEASETDEKTEEKAGKEMSDIRTNPLGEGVMKIVYFEAGHADSFLLYTDNAAILIDTGEKGFGKNILKYMEKEGIGRLDYMIITHFDKDHVGGAAKVIKKAPVGQIYTGNFLKDSEEMFDFSDTVNENEVPCSMLFENLDFTVDDIHVDINVPKRMVYEEAPSNNSSLIVRVTYNDKVFLFMADAESTRIREYLSDEPAACDVLKVPYHGIFQGCLVELLEEVKPEYAVITSSKQEKEDNETVELLKDYGIAVYRSRKGDITVTCSSNGIQIKQ